MPRLTEKAILVGGVIQGIESGTSKRDDNGKYMADVTEVG